MTAKRHEDMEPPECDTDCHGQYQCKSCGMSTYLDEDRICEECRPEPEEEE